MAPPEKPRYAGPEDAIERVVLELLESDGYDAVQLREVARTAHVGLGTIYKRFDNRENLIVTVLERWMAANAYSALEAPDDNESIYEGIMRTFRWVFEPWERRPGLLAAYWRARSGPYGDRLARQGAQAVGPIGRQLLEGADPTYVEDISIILTTMVQGVQARFAAGEIEITDILPTLERTISRLTSNNEPLAQSARKRSPTDLQSPE